MAIAEDKRRLVVRISAIQGVVLAAFVLLAGGFWFFQIAQHARFQEMAENNHQRTLPLRAPRGVILDRLGRVVVENRSSFNISILREHSKDLERTIELLARVTDVPADGDPRHRRASPSRAKLPAGRRHQRRQLAQRRRGRGTALSSSCRMSSCRKCRRGSTRSESLAAHLIGYVGEASEEQITGGGLSLGTIVGQTGVEKIYNQLLMGRGRRAPRGRQQPGAGDSRDRQGAVRPRAAACS